MDARKEGMEAICDAWHVVGKGERSVGWGCHYFDVRRIFVKLGPGKLCSCDVCSYVTR